MLVDLEFVDELLSTYGIAGDDVKFDKSDGGLKVKIINPNKPGVFEYTFAVRERQGVYWDDQNLHGPIEDWTKYSLLHPRDDPDSLERLDTLEEQFQANPENEMLEKAFFAEVARQHGGVADYLDQVFSLGRDLIASPDLYVLGIDRVTQLEDGSARWHKLGQYIGKHTDIGYRLSDKPEIKELIAFEFYRLIPEEQEE